MGLNEMEKLEEAIKNLREDVYRDMDARMAYDGLEHTFVAFKKDYVIVPRKPLEDERLRIDIQRKKTLQSLSDFYDRLPNINDAKIAMVEFQAHTEELIDYIGELETIWNKLLPMSKDEEMRRQLIANRPKLAPPEYKPRKYSNEIRGVHK